MHIGVNWLSPHALPLIKSLIREGHADYCEIMVDNAIHLSPEKIKSTFHDIPLAFHIVSSRFLERSSNELNDIAKHIRKLITVLQPIYVSDHLAQFSTHDGKRLPRIVELDYQAKQFHIEQRASLWQHMLETPLLLENFASSCGKGKNQPAFFHDILANSNTNLLFDFSNAYIAEYNQITHVSDWDTLIQQANYFHVGGFRVDQATNIAIDTHDVALAPEVIALIKHYRHQLTGKHLVVEFDEYAGLDLWQEQIRQVKGAVT